MNIDQCKVGLNSGPLCLEFINTSRLTEDLLKIVTSDSSKSRINIFIEGANLIRLFSQARQGTQIHLRDFAISQDFTQISQFFPTYITGEEVVRHDSNTNLFIHINCPIPNITLQYLSKSLSLGPDDNFDAVNILELYEAKKVSQVQNEKIGGKNKCCTLKEVSEKLLGNTVYAWCYAVIVDSCSSYIRKQSEGGDYIATLKLTDSSIFPNCITLTIFHKSPKDIPKVANFGDIIKLNDVQFREHNGLMAATIPSSTKTMSFYLFSYTGEEISPYAYYKSNFHTNAEHALRLQKISDWTRLTFAYEVPLFMKNTKTLSSLALNEEADIRTRVLQICSLGINDHDPAVVICADSEEICQIVIPHERKRLLKFIKAGDLIRLRGVVYEEKVLILKPYSEILRIPSEFKCLDVVCNITQAEIDKFLRIYVDVPAMHCISKIVHEYASVPLVPFCKLLGNENKVIKIEGFVVKMMIRKKNIEITIWDGTAEDNLITVYVQQEDIQKFLNGKSWDIAQKDTIGHNSKFQGVIIKETEEFRLVGTILVN